jgi:hypothetical protein
MANGIAYLLLPALLWVFKADEITHIIVQNAV